MNKSHWLEYASTLDQLKEKKLPSAEEIESLCEKVEELLDQEENVVRVPAPCTLVGDIHGQFYDLLEMFKVGGECPTTNYVFCGDYVDRGHYSVEVVLVLLILKVRYPSRIILLRGNHESRQITQVYGFYDECLRKFGSEKVWRHCMKVFDLLPLGCLVGDKILCLHAGLSPSLDKIDQMQDMIRKQEVPHEGPMCDLMWSDPDEITGWSLSPRGAGYVFGQDIVQQFCMMNNIDLIVRSHQLIMSGHEYRFDNQLITVWSAPNYCYRCGNVASILQVTENLARVPLTFTDAPYSERERPSHKQMPDYFL